MIAIDGVPCDRVDNEVPERPARAEPESVAIAQIQKWHDSGQPIGFSTVRPEAHSDVTEAWLDRHGVRYHREIDEQPRAIIAEVCACIDDRPVRTTRHKVRSSDLVRKPKDILVFGND